MLIDIVDKVGGVEVDVPVRMKYDDPTQNLHIDLKKGTQVYIEGKLRTRSWDDQNGIRRYTTEIYADNMELLGRRADQSNTVSGNKVTTKKWNTEE